MKKLLFLTLFFVTSGHTALLDALNSVECPDQINWVTVAGECPPYLTAAQPGDDVQAATTNSSVRTTHAGTPIYSCILPAGDTDRTCAQIQAGNGCTDTSVVTPGSTGIVEFDGASNYAGLAAQTNYKFNKCQFNGSKVSAVVVSASFPTAVGGGSGGTDLAGTNSRFVDSVSGSDSNDGLSHVNAWQTLGKVTSTSLPTGTNVYLLAGTVFEDEQLPIGWSGTSGDIAVIGCYYLDTGNSNQLTSCHEGTLAGTLTLPEINGNFDDTCRTNFRADPSSCRPFGGPGSNVVNAIPSSIYTGLVRLNHHTSAQRSAGQNQKYVTVQDISIKDSAGLCFEAGNRNEHITVQRVECSYSGFAGLDASYDSSYTTFKDVDVHHTVYCPMWFLGAGASNQAAIPDNCVIDYPSAVIISNNFSDTSSGSWTLVEDLDIYHSYGEGIGAFFCGKTIVRGNRIRDTRRNAIYIDSCSDTLAEANIIWNTAADDIDFGDYDVPVGIAVFVENDLGDKQHNEDNEIRNNLIAATGWCFQQSSTVGGAQPHMRIGAAYRNNICLEPTTMGADFAPSSQDTTAGINTELTYENNIVYAPALSAANVCTSAGSGVYGTYSFENNSWSPNPSDSDCDDNEDITGKPTLARDAATFEKAQWTISTGPTFADVVLQVGDARINAGKVQNATVHDLSEFVNLTTYGDYPFTPSASTWNLEVGIDATGANRGSPPNLGPEETN